MFKKFFFISILFLSSFSLFSKTEKTQSEEGNHNSYSSNFSISKGIRLQEGDSMLVLDIKLIKNI